MQEKNKYVYILTSDEPIEKELDLVRNCRQNHISVSRVFQGKQEVLQCIKNTKLEIE